MEDAFAGYHPAVNFIFFMGAILMGMFFVHPFFLGVSMAASTLYYLLLTGRKGLRFLVSMLVMAVVLSLINPFLNTQGETVLFSYFRGRPFTLEALQYGMATAGVFFTIMLWFACYNRLMTSDKFFYLFGRFAPAITLLLSMVLRLVPNFKKKAAAIAGARKCVGKSPVNGSSREKVEHGVEILSVLTSWSLEGAVETADSMKSRGYGSGKRSQFSIYRFRGKDRTAGAVMAAGVLLIAAAAFLGRCRITYTPVFSMPETDAVTVAGLTGYAVFLLLPSALHIWEKLLWHILRSKI